MKNIILFVSVLFLVIGVQAKSHQAIKSKSKTHAVAHHPKAKKSVKKTASHKVKPVKVKPRKTASVSPKKVKGKKSKKAPKVTFYPKEDCDKVIQAPVAFTKNEGRAPASQADESSANKTLFKQKSYCWIANNHVAP